MRDTYELKHLSINYIVKNWSSSRLATSRNYCNFTRVNKKNNFLEVEKRKSWSIAEVDDLWSSLLMGT